MKVLLLMLGTATASPTVASFAENATTVHGRALISQGCLDCCFGHNCIAGFNGMPGMCCGSLPAAGCCPMGATCVRCNSHFRCTNSRTVTRASKCSICADDRPSDCYAMMNGPMYHSTGGGSFIGSLFSLVFLVALVCLVASCFRGATAAEPVVVGVPAGPGGPGYPGGYPGGVTVVQPGYGGCYGGGCGGVAGGAAAGFVGGMLVGQALDHGGGYCGGGYGCGGGYCGGDMGGGMMGGGDAGFAADE